jgi:ABC-type transport system involved in multi-copper enzyme maturation permease subunit
LFLGFINWDDIDNTRGQILVDRFANEPMIAFFDRITMGDVDSADSAVQGIAIFSPAADSQQLLFMLALSVTLLGIFASAYTIVDERSLFLRERMANLKVRSYLMSKFVVYSVLVTFSVGLTLVALSLGVRLPSDGLIMPGPLELFITLTLTALSGVGIGLLISSLTKESNAVTYIVLALLFVQILFPGVLFPMTGVLEPVSRMTVTRWSLEALGGTTDIEERDSEGHFIVETLPLSRSGTPIEAAPPARQPYRTPSALSVGYATEAQELAVRWGVLLLFTTASLVAAGFALNRDESF